MEVSLQNVRSSKWSSGLYAEPTLLHHSCESLDNRMMDLEDSTSPTLSTSMEELVNLDQLLAELSATPDQLPLDMEHSLPNSYPDNQEKSDIKSTNQEPLEDDLVSDDAWCLLDELEGLNNISGTYPTVDSAGRTNPSLNLNMDYLQNPEFFNLTMINDTLRELQSAPDSADCTVVHNPLFNYLLGDAKNSTRNGSNRDKNSSWMTTSSQDISFLPENKVVLKPGPCKNNCKDDHFEEIETNLLPEEQHVYDTTVVDEAALNSCEPVLLPEENSMCIDFAENDYIKVDDQENDCSISTGPISPFLLPTENSVCINTLLSSSTVPTLQLPTQPVALGAPDNTALSLILSAVGISPEQYATVKIIEPDADNQVGEPMYTIILDAPDVQPQPLQSISPALSIASTSSQQSTRKRTATGDSCRSVVSNSTVSDDLYSSAVPGADDSPAAKIQRIKSEDEDEGEDKYCDMRKKNNEASRRSRQNRREREREMEKEVLKLTEQNKELKQRMDVLQNLVNRVKETVISAISKRVQ